LRGEFIRKPLEVRSWEAAQKTVREWEGYGPKNAVLLDDAYKRFIAQHEANGSAPDTVAKHARLKVRAIEFFGDVSLRLLRCRRSDRALPVVLHFCVAREWLEKNPARALKLPKIEEVEVKPYTPKELEAIMNAVEEYPNCVIYKTNTRARVLHSFSPLGGPG